MSLRTCNSDQFLLLQRLQHFRAAAAREFMNQIVRDAHQITVMVGGRVVPLTCVPPSAAFPSPVLQPQSARPLRLSPRPPPPSTAFQFPALQPQSATPLRLPRPAPSSTGFQFPALQQPQVLTAAGTKWQWDTGHLLGQLLIPAPREAEVSSEHELAAEALVSMAEVKRKLAMAQQDMKSAPSAPQSVKRAPWQRLGLDLTGAGAAEVLTDYDIEGARLLMMGGAAPPRVYGSPAAQHQGASVEETSTLTAREEVRRLLELARSSQGEPAGYEGVYKSGAGFGAELRKGTKRLRQTGFSSAFEAALERARWAKPNPSPKEVEGPQEVAGAQDDAPQRPRAESAQLTPAETAPHQGVATDEANQEFTPLANATNNSASAPSLSLREKFELHVMCNYTPTHPNNLQKLSWVSYKTLLRQLEVHAPTEVWKLGPSNLKQLITEWLKDHPAFSGLSFSDWCKKLKDHDPQAPGRSQVFKFCFEYTPGGVKGVRHFGGVSTPIQNASAICPWTGRIGAGAGLSASPEVPSVQPGCNLVWQCGRSGWEVRPSVKHGHAAGHNAKLYQLLYEAREGVAQPQVNMVPEFHYSQAAPPGLGSSMRQ